MSCGFDHAATSLVGKRCTLAVFDVIHMLERAITQSNICIFRQIRHHNPLAQLPGSPLARRRCPCTSERFGSTPLDFCVLHCRVQKILLLQHSAVPITTRGEMVLDSVDNNHKLKLDVPPAARRRRLLCNLNPRMPPDSQFHLRSVRLLSLSTLLSVVNE